jgi:SOS-response transcriptional repressor LexA
LSVKEVVKKARLEKKLYQSQLGDLVGCSQQTIVDIESGIIKKSSFLPDICAALEIDYHRLMKNPDAPLESLRQFKFSSRPVIHADQVSTFLSTPEAVTPSKYLPTASEVSDSAYWVQVDTDVMEPELRFGDYALVDPQNEMKSGTLVALFIGESTHPTFRKRFKDGASEMFIAVKTGERVSAVTSGGKTASKIGGIVESATFL